MTSNDLDNMKMFQPWLYAYLKKARNPENLVFDLLMTYNDL